MFCPLWGRSPVKLSRLQGQANNVFVVANSNFLVIVGNAKLLKINRQEQSAFVVSQWAVVTHT
jgi:hypothetical protein